MLPPWSYFQPFITDRSTENIDPRNPRDGYHRGPGERASGSPEQGIAICLSGGGYRAMLFHTGVIWRLAELDLLGPVTHNIRKAGGSPQPAGTLQRISSVSGGSLLAGMLGLKWKELAVAQPGLVD